VLAEVLFATDNVVREQRRLPTSGATLPVATIFLKMSGNERWEGCTWFDVRRVVEKKNEAACTLAAGGMYASR
jgi:hypothetical protein